MLHGFGDTITCSLGIIESKILERGGTEICLNSNGGIKVKNRKDVKWI